MPEKTETATEHVHAAAASALPAAHAKPKRPAQTIFDVRDVDVHYGTHKAVTGINLPVDAGFLAGSTWGAYGGLPQPPAS